MPYPEPQPEPDGELILLVEQDGAVLGIRLNIRSPVSFESDLDKSQQSDEEPTP